MRLESTAEMMRTAACLHRHHTGGQARPQLDHAVAVHAPTQDDPPCCIKSRHAAAVLTQIDPYHRDLHRSAPFPLVAPQPNATG